MKLDPPAFKKKVNLHLFQFKLKAGGLSLRLFTENNEGLAFVLIVNTRFLDSLPIKLRQLSWRGFILNLQV